MKRQGRSLDHFQREPKIFEILATMAGRRRKVLGSGPVKKPNSHAQDCLSEISFQSTWHLELSGGVSDLKIAQTYFYL